MRLVLVVLALNTKSAVGASAYLRHLSNMICLFGLSKMLLVFSGVVDVVLPCARFGVLNETVI